jgi:cation transport ATPase
LSLDTSPNPHAASVAGKAVAHSTEKKESQLASHEEAHRTLAEEAHRKLAQEVRLGPHHAAKLAEHVKKSSTNHAAKDTPWGYSSVWSEARDVADDPEAKREASKLGPLAAVVTAMLTMLTIGGDDVIWLLPFFVDEKRKVTKTVAYIIFMEVVVVVSWMIKEAMRAIEVQHPDAPIQKVIQCVSSVLLTMFCTYLFHEWWNEEPDDDDDEDSDAVKSERTSSEKAESDDTQKAPSDEASVNEGRIGVARESTPGVPHEVYDEKQALAKIRHAEDSSVVSTPGEHFTPAGPAEAHLHLSAPHNQHHEKMGLWMLFVVSMVGSLDNFAVYSYFLFSGMMTGWQLFLGVMIASIIISAVAHGALAFKPVLKLVEKLPLWVIFACLCIWSYSEIIWD